jgi:hypothetical protein
MQSHSPPCRAWTASVHHGSVARVGCQDVYPWSSSRHRDVEVHERCGGGSDVKGRDWAMSCHVSELALAAAPWTPLPTDPSDRLAPGSGRRPFIPTGPGLLCCRGLYDALGSRARLPWQKKQTQTLRESKSDPGTTGGSHSGPGTSGTDSRVEARSVPKRPWRVGG